MSEPWWHGAVIYQLYARSWRDSGGDGIGDLRGIIERLDHLSWLGVDGIWLSPTMPSPDADWGYDVSDYTGVHPELGTLADLDELTGQALLVAVNLSARPASLPAAVSAAAGEVLLTASGTAPSSPPSALGPWEGIIARISPTAV